MTPAEMDSHPDLIALPSVTSLEALRGLLTALERVESASAAVELRRAETVARFETSARDLCASEVYEEREALERDRRALLDEVRTLDRERVRLARLKVTALERSEAAASRALAASIEDAETLARGVVSW